MVSITKAERERLEQVGLWKHKRKFKDGNFSITNKYHKSRAKTYYVIEEYSVMRRLERWGRANVIKITNEQLTKLKEKKLVFDKSIQTYTDYNPKANCFISHSGEIYVARSENIMNALREM